MRLATIPIFLIVLLCALCPVQAGTLLDGQTVLLTYEFPRLGTNFDSQTVVVGPGVEALGFPAGDPRTNIDLSDTNIYVNYSSASTWSGAEFSGIHVYDVNGTIPAFTSVTINTATNLAGLDASRISFDANNIWVNWNGLTFDTSTIVSLDVTGGSAVPEPASAVLIGFGLFALGIAGRKLG